MVAFFFPQILKSAGWLSAFPPPFPNARGFCKIRMHGISEGFSYSHGVGPQCILVGKEDLVGALSLDVTRLLALVASSLTGGLGRAVSGEMANLATVVALLTLGAVTYAS